MIRTATKYDINSLVEMMRQYASEAPIEILKNPDYQDPSYVQKFLYSLIAGQGFILVDKQLNGMLLAVIVPNVWCPKVLELKELAWWVKPEHRNGTLGGKLWLEFNNQGNKMLESGRVKIVTTSSMVTSPKLDYVKRGFKQLETTYYKE
jgi:hypothetical protein